MTIKIIENIDHFNWKFSRVYMNLVLFSKRDTVTSLLFVPNFSETLFFSFPSIFSTPLLDADAYRMELLHKGTRWKWRKKNSPNFHSIKTVRKTNKTFESNLGAVFAKILRMKINQLCACNLLDGLVLCPN